MRNMLACAVACLAGLPAFAAAEGAPSPGVPKFRAQEIDRSLKVGYAVKLVDLNGDGKLDILVPDSERVIWFENPGSAGPDAPWKLHTIVDDKKAGIKTDNVCIEVLDIDGDGKPDIFLGADWQPGNTKGGGSLQWLRQPANIDDPWEVHPIVDSIPTLHRIHLGRLQPGGKPELLVSPLKGKDSTGPANFMDHGVRLVAYPVPKDPAHDKWEGHLLTDELHVMHNFLPVAWDRCGTDQILTASYEGVNVLRKCEASGAWKLERLGEGDQADPKASHGAGEIKLGTLRNERFLATIEPFHGNQVVVYTPPEGKEKPDTLWTRTVLDTSFKEGHGIWCADLDKDGADEVVAGWRGGDMPGIRIFKAGEGATPSWQMTELDPGGVAVEDLACADLNGDGKIDIVAVGRATHNVKIYWNEGPAAGK